MTSLSLAASHAANLTPTSNMLLDSTLVMVMLFVTAFLVILNTAFAVAFRKKRALEVLSFIGAGLIELAIFVFLLALHMGMLTHIPLNLPSGLPFDRSEIGGAIALAIGLFPAANWQRTSMSQLRQRMADDARVIKNRDGVRIRSNAPGEWLN